MKQMSRSIRPTHKAESRGTLVAFNPHNFFNMEVGEPQAVYYPENLSMLSGSDFLFPSVNMPAYMHGGYCMKEDVDGFPDYSMPQDQLGEPIEFGRHATSGVHADKVRFILETSRPTITTDEFMRRHSIPDIQLADEKDSPILRSDGFPEEQMNRKASKKLTNRAAAVRCRVRKASWVKDTRDKLESDRESNKDMLQTIVELQQEIFKIHRILSTASVTCPSTFRPRNKLPQDNTDIE
ncbi:hypothetical protein DSO57_1010845 [Entomophthora muscae]|uniref:Uncharacterized protein n=1 Tax=Entomophthora muscae TaxID=34485 RepID=A0ACC2RXM5_9FUNG|nr:hypothetical protein DSO57_1010845 [Entomophthora muscae]